MAIYSNSASAPASFASASTPTFEVPFEPKSIVLINENDDIANYVEISFDGVNVHGRLTPTVLAAFRFEQRVQKVWIRGVGTPVTRLVAEA